MSLSARGRSKTCFLVAFLAVALELGIVGRATSAPLAGMLQLASASDAGIKAAASAHDPSISAEGSTVAFQSSATNLDPADRDAAVDVYVKNVATGDIEVASTSDAGAKGNSGSFFGFPAGLNSLSADGTRVVFHSFATNLDPADTDSLLDVYVKDLSTGDVTLASTSDTGVKGNSLNFVSCISGDGSRVAFVSVSTNLDPADTDTATDLYVKDLRTGDVTLASTSDSGIKGQGPVGGTCALSSAGTKVAFLSQASLDPRDTDSALDVYVKNIVTGDVTLASTADGGVKLPGAGAEFGGGMTLSANGTRVAFTSLGRLDAVDTDTNSDVYVKDLASEETMLASTSSAGTKGNRGSFGPSLSAGGDQVAFTSSATNLDPGAAGSTDVYVKDLDSGELRLVSASSGGVAGNAEDSFAALSGDASRVAFRSGSTNLHAADTDPLSDVYVKTLAFSDSTPPVITVPDDLEVDATEFDGAPVAYAATALDDVDGVVPVTCVPASGSVFPIGFTVVSCTAVDSSGNASSAAFRIRVLGAEAQLQAVAAGLRAIEGSSADAVVDKVEDARAKLESALVRLAHDRTGALGEIEGGVGDLESAVDDGLLDAAQGTALLTRLAGTARLLALDAVADARARGAEGEKIAEATEALARGDTLRAAGRYKDAVGKYRDAASKAGGA